VENLDGKKNCDIPEIHLAIEERILDLVIRGPEALVEMVEEESPMTEDINIQQIDMFGLSDD
jgi:hypothetical protein